MVAEISDQHESEWAAMGEVARLLGIGTAETVRKWVLMHLDQRRSAATARRLIVQEIQIGQAAQRAPNGALMRPRRAQVHELAQPNPVVPDPGPIPRKLFSRRFW